MIVYKISNNFNKKIYIGCTKQTLKKRIATHKSFSKNVVKSEIHKAMNEMGFDNFKFKILYEGEQGRDKENYYIKKYLKDGYELYNKNIKSNISKLFYSKDITTGEIEEYYKVDYKKFNPARVSEVLNKKNVDKKTKYKRFSYKNKVWSYENNEIIWNKLLKANYFKNSMCSKKKVMNIDTGEIFNSIQEASLAYGAKKRSSSITNAIKNNYKAFGYRWKTVD